MLGSTEAFPLSADIFVQLCSKPPFTLKTAALSDVSVLADLGCFTSLSPSSVKQSCDEAFADKAFQVDILHTDKHSLTSCETTDGQPAQVAEIALHFAKQ